MYSAAYSLRRAVQRDARARTRAYWAASHERGQDAVSVRERLGLSRKGLENAAYAHLEGAPHLRRGMTKALAMHLADSVWNATERHLFADATGKRTGMPQPGAWFDFAGLVGRARSHTRERKWETFRLHGSLGGHRGAYTGNDSRFVQPDRLRPVLEPDDGWWHYAGPLAVVFTGLPIGMLVLPVRLPTAPSNQPILEHHLADPSRWHKLDMIRHRDPTSPGGWRYEAHLYVLTTLYIAPTAVARRAKALATNANRRAGIDVNVSNVTVASHSNGEDLRVTRVVQDDSARRTMAARVKRQRCKNRRVERSRRATNPEQYELSARQKAHNQRREQAGLSPVQMIPRGPRRRRTNGAPQSAYRDDTLSGTYRRERAAAACEGEAAARARREFARQIAARLVCDHGFSFVSEDCNLQSWSRRWGRRMAAFTPGLLVSALERETAAVKRLGSASGVERAATQTTAMSQHCLCGKRVAKSLTERTHVCGGCGLCGDRDAVSATLAACVTFAAQGVPASARVDFGLAGELLDAPSTRERLFATLPYVLQGRQDVQSESTAHSARDGSSVAGRGPTPDRLVMVARRIVGTASYPTLDERGGLDRHTTPERVRTRTNLFPNTGENSTDYRTVLRTACGNREGSSPARH